MKPAMVDLKEQTTAMTPGHHMGVSAGAGSGKTRVLTGRILRILSEAPPADRAAMLERIVAVTFTIEAAGEIRDRVRSVIFGALERSADPREKQSWLEVLEKLPEARISTLHGLASRLLRQSALDSGVDPGFTLDEMPGTDEHSSADTYLAELLDPARRPEKNAAEPLAALKKLLVRWDVWPLSRLLDALDGRRDALEAWAYQLDVPQETPEKPWDPSAYAVRESRGRLHRALTVAGPYREYVLKSAQECLAILGDPDRFISKRAGLYKKGPPCAQAIIRFLAEPDSDGSLFGSLVEKVSGLGKVSVEEKWFARSSDGLLVKQFFGDVGAWIAVPEKTKSPDWPVSLNELLENGEELQAAVDRLLEEDRQNLAVLVRGWTGWRRQRGRGISRLDFDDLEVEFERVLRLNGETRARIGKSISHLLVDEFQDTSPLQWKFLRYLIGSLDPSADVFLVGDEKQSIYAFRRADVTVFGRALDDLHRHNVDRKQLAEGVNTRGSLLKSFRASRNVLESVNRIFEIAFPGDEALSFEARRQSLEPVDGSTREGGIVEWIADPDGNPKKEASRLLELQALAARLKEVHGSKLPPEGDGTVRHIRWEDCAVICRSHRQIMAVETELLEAGIPCRRRAERGFYETREIIDLVAALAVLHSPVTPADLLAFFLSPLAALPLDVPFMMTGARNPGDKFASSSDPAKRFDHWMRQMDETGGGSPDLEFVAGELCKRDLNAAADRCITTSVAVWEARLALKSSGAAAGLEKLLDRTGARAAFAVGTGGPSRLANVEKFIALVYARECDGLDLGAMLEEFRRLIELGEAARVPTAPWGDSDDRVSILTIHGAKGLEFEAVFLPFCGENSGGGSKREVYWLPKEGGQIPVFSLPPAPGDEYLKPSEFIAAHAAAQARETAEELRLFYVAATRARHILCFLSSGGRGVVQHLRYAFGPEAVAEPDIRSGPAGAFRASVVPLRLLSKRSGQARPDTYGTLLKKLDALPLGLPADLFPVPAASRRRIVLDFTSIRTFLSCELQYYYRHLLEVPQHRWFTAPTGGAQAAIDRLPAHVRGTLLHKALELESVGDKYLEWMKFELNRQGVEFTDSLLRDVIDSADGAIRFQSELLKPRLEAAKEIRREWSFLARYRSAEDLDVDIRGAIDLAFDTGSGWEIIDYKSGRVGGASKAAAKIREENYDLQLAIYKWALERTGLPVVATRIAWIDEGFITDVKDLPGPEVIAASIERCASGILTGCFAGAFTISGRGEPPPVCENCGYKAHGLCREFDRQSRGK